MVNLDVSKTRMIKIISIALAMLIFMTGCASNADPLPSPQPTAPATDVPTEEAATQGQGEKLILLYFQAPTTANPHLSPGTKDLSASRIAYEPLASFDIDGNLVPILAAEVPSVENGGVAEDGTSVTWKLREDIKWADGETFTADDVLFTYQYATNPDVQATSALAYSDVENVEKLDDYTVKINFNKPTAAWYSAFVGPFGMIIPQHLFQDYNGENAADAPNNLMAVGTGPYYVSEWRNEDVLLIGGNAVSTNKIIYDINPHYRESDKPYFSQVEVRGGGDLDLAVQAGKEGTVDFIFNLAVTPDKIEDMESTGHTIVATYVTPFTERIMINFSDPDKETAEGERSSTQFPHPFLTDKVVREAIAIAIDRELIAEWYGNGGVIVNNILAQPPYFASSETSIEYNPERAASLLEEAGWVDEDGDGIREKDGVEMRLVFQTSIQALRQQTQEQVKKDLEAIGIAVELKQIDSSIFFGPPTDTVDTRRQFYADLEEFAFSNKSPDPTAYMAGWTCDNIAQKENDWSLPNWSRYCNPEFDTLFNQASTELDPDKRAELFVKMNEVLINDFGVIPLVNIQFQAGMNADLKGYNLTPWDVDLWDIANWYK